MASSKANIEIDLPEFGHSFSWATCRNPMCKNFGVPYNGELPVGNQKSAADKDDDNHERYRLSAEGRFCCKHCDQSFVLKSNRALRPIAQYYLSLSLPFATCQNVKCDAHGFNVFEHHLNKRGPYYSAGAATIGSAAGLSR